jgi:hypothetical protein
MKLTKACAIALVLAGNLLIAGCATAPQEKPESGDAAAGVADTTAGGKVAVSADPHAPLERRATDRWKLLIGAEPKRAYQYLTPGYRATKSEKDYVDWAAARQVVWTQAQYQDHTCSDPESCKVGLQLTVKVKLRGVAGEHDTTTYISENWLKIDGVWYHLPKDGQ